MIEITGNYNTAKCYASTLEDGAREQIRTVCDMKEFAASKIRIMPDVHTGKGCTIGTTMTVTDKIVPAMVGVDIGCGMYTVALGKVDIDLEKFDEAAHFIPSGREVWEGRGERFDLTVLRCYRYLRDAKRLERSLGTLGGGNHFIELQKSTALDGAGEPEGGAKVWLMIHSGSRNMGKRIEEHYHKIADRMCTRYRVALADKDLAFLPIEEEAGHHYFTDMLFALRYAKENRRRMMESMKETLSEFAPEVNFLRTIDIHHNYAAFEEHFGKKVCVHRKGATSAKLDEIGIIPGSMGTASYIVRGLGNPESFMSCSHGAGRRMSRVAASMNLTVEECDKAMEGIVCERWSKYTGYSRKAKGCLDLSEAPQAYKDIESVIDAERDLIEPLVRLVPMASLKG